MIDGVNLKRYSELIQIEDKNKPQRKKTERIFLFALLSIILISALQAGPYFVNARKASEEILGVTTTAYEDLDSASKFLSQQNFLDAKQLFESASQNVKLAQDKLSNYKALTLITPQGDSANHVLKGAASLAQAGEKLSEALELFSEFKVSSDGVETINFQQKIIKNRELLAHSLELVSTSSVEFEQVKNIPLDYTETLNQAKLQISQLKLVLTKLVGLEDLYISVFNKQKTYLLIFQNYDEVRATGGFVGTYGVVTFDSGKILKLAIDSIYDLDGKIYEQIASPGPMQPDIARWGMRDANWFADFRISAQKLLYFFEKGQSSADGVISITPKVFVDLLNLTGPIEMKSYNVVLNAQNFQDIVQYKTSVDYDREENEPKKMLADFAPVLLDRLANLQNDQWLNFFQIMQENLNQRNILLYSKDPNVQNVIESLGFSGKILETDHDYLNIVNSNLGGTKTDLEMEQRVNLKSKILSDNSILNTLTITRKNTSEIHNKNFMRVMVPLNSQLVSSVGFDDLPLLNSVSEGLKTDPDLEAWDKGVESGKTEFKGWIDIEGLNEKAITLTYILPFKAGRTHSLLVQKQAGSKPYDFEGSLSLGSFSPSWASQGVTQSLNKLNFRSNSNTDDFWGAVLN